METSNQVQANDGHSSEIYKPVQRITQACQPCRKRKGRCSGHRPKCQSCRRFSRDCVYPETSTGTKRSSSEQAGEALVSLLESVQEVSTQVSRIEQRLSLIEQRLHHSGLGTASASHQTVGCQAFLKTFKIRSDDSAAEVSTEPTENKDEPVLFSGLLPLPIILETLDIYFTYCHNQPYSFFHEGNFRRKLSEGNIPDHLLFAILALGIRFSKNPFFKDNFATAVFYVNKSWRSIVSSCFSANKVADLMTVQTVTLLSIHDYTAGKSRHGGAWVKIGLAVRIAQDLKLMLESANHLPYTEQEERRRTFWSIYLLDRLASCGRARPPAILDMSCQLQLPCDEISWRAGVWKETLSLQQLSQRTLPPDEQQGPFSHVVAMAYTLSRAAQYMLQQFSMRDRDTLWDANSDYASIQSDLLYMETFLEIHRSPKEMINQYASAGQIDQQCTGPIIFARALFHLCYCIINHPFLLRRRLDCCPVTAPPSFLSRSFDTAWEHSRRMANLFDEVRQAGAIAHTSFYGYCVVVAGTIAALYLNDSSVTRRMEASAILQMHLTYLEDIGGYWKNVSHMWNALRNFSEDALRFSSLTSDSRVNEPLSIEAYETLWTLVDYSSMSDEIHVVQSQPSHSDPWLDANPNWNDIFGVVDSLKSVPQTSFKSMTQTADYTQYAMSRYSDKL